MIEDEDVRGRIVDKIDKRMRIVDKIYSDHHPVEVWVEVKMERKRREERIEGVGRVIRDEEGREMFRKKMALKKTMGEVWGDRIENKKDHEGDRGRTGKKKKNKKGMVG